MNTQHSFQGSTCWGFTTLCPCGVLLKNLAQPTHGTGEYPTAAAIGIGAAIGALVVGVLCGTWSHGILRGQTDQPAMGGAGGGWTVRRAWHGRAPAFGKGTK